MMAHFGKKFTEVHQEQRCLQRHGVNIATCSIYVYFFLPLFRHHLMCVCVCLCWCLCQMCLYLYLCLCLVLQISVKAATVASTHLNDVLEAGSATVRCADSKTTVPLNQHCWRCRQIRFPSLSPSLSLSLSPLASSIVSLQQYQLPSLMTFTHCLQRSHHLSLHPPSSHSLPRLLTLCMTMRECSTVSRHVYNAHKICIETPRMKKWEKARNALRCCFFTQLLATSLNFMAQPTTTTTTTITVATAATAPTTTTRNKSMSKSFPLDSPLSTSLASFSLSDWWQRQRQTHQKCGFVLFNLWISLRTAQLSVAGAATQTPLPSPSLQETNKVQTPGGRSLESWQSSWVCSHVYVCVCVCVWW